MYLAHYKILLLLVKHCIMLTTFSLQNSSPAVFTLHVNGTLPNGAFAIYVMHAAQTLRTFTSSAFAFNVALPCDLFAIFSMHAHTLQSRAFTLFYIACRGRHMAESFADFTLHGSLALRNPAFANFYCK